MCEQTKFRPTHQAFEGFSGSSAVENEAASEGAADLIPGSGRSPREMATHSSLLAWRIPWTEEPGRLQSMRSEESDTNEQLNSKNPQSSTVAARGSLTE